MLHNSENMLFEKSNQFVSFVKLLSSKSFVAFDDEQL